MHADREEATLKQKIVASAVLGASLEPLRKKSRGGAGYFIIGGGIAGIQAADIANAGYKVFLVEKHLLGVKCLSWTNLPRWTVLPAFSQKW